MTRFGSFDHSGPPSVESSDKIAPETGSGSLSLFEYFDDCDCGDPHIRFHLSRSF